MVRLGIAATLKNEAPYILEWLAFHRAVGFSRFILSDDLSDDGTAEILEGLAEAGIIDVLPPIDSRGPRQLAVYQAAMDRFRDEVDWMAFLDADEFAVPKKGTLVDALNPVLRNERVGAIALNWACYGAGDHETSSSEPVLTRFTRRGPASWSVNHHFKTLVRSTAYLATGSNPHFVRLRPGWTYVHTNGRPVLHNKSLFGLSQRVVWNRVKLNHYAVKSREEFVAHKMLRGDAMAGRVPKTMDYFNHHNRNDELDPVAPDLIRRMRSELDSLRSKLAGLGLSRHARIGAGVEVNEPLHSVVSLSNSPVIFAHVFYPDVWSEIVDALNASALNFRLVVTMPDGHPNPRIPDGATDYEVITVQNRGRDVRPFLQALRETKFEYDLGLKIHTKMSLHRDDGEAWRRALLRSLLGTADHSHEIVRRLQTFPSIGLVGPSGHKVSIEEFGFENNVEKMKSILPPHTNLEGRMFFAGTMFWFRRQAFTELMIPSPDIFEEESGQVDGTFAHAYERSFSIICEERGLESVSVEELLAGRSPRTIDHRRDAVSIYLRPGHVTLEEYEQSRGLLPALVRNETLRSVFRRLPAPVKNFVRARILQ